MIGTTLSLCVALLNLGPSQDPSEGWESLFDGKSLDGWSAKIRGRALGDNSQNTFRVSPQGTIQVNYDQYKQFDDQFGHLFYKKPYSHYILKLEYRFFGDQVSGGPGWAFKNSGIMIHCQNPKTMTVHQSFPVSAEVQFLGGEAQGERSTGNLCTPGTHVVMNNQLITQHVINSTGPTIRGSDWVEAEVEAHGNGTIIHRINGKEVIRYEKLQLDPKDNDAKPLIKGDKLMVSEGWISLQSESHPIEFRNIRIKELPSH